MTRHRIRLEPFCGAILVALTATSAGGQPSSFSTGKSHWLASRYSQALPPLKAARVAPNGRNAEVDYMLGTSGCRITAQRRWGARVLNFALYSYPLTSASRATITSERNRCLASGSLAPLSSAARVAVSSAVVAGATARGKMYNSGGKGAASYPARRIRELSPGEMGTRLVPLGQPAEITRVLRRLVPGARVQIHGRYAIATTAGQSQAEIRRMAAQLDRYATFLTREYGFALPNQYITLYLVPDIRSIQAFADKVHGLDVSPSTLGYSFQDDLSAVGMIRGTYTGTLRHELFHLLVRTSFGDIPQWLDEGIASLYEVSADRGDRFVGLPNWRGRVLRSAENQRPSLQSVISSPWFEFDRTDGQEHRWMMSEERAAVHLATARYLALYLQEKGALRNVFEAFKMRDPGAADDPELAAVAIVAERLGPPAEAQSAYDAWLQDAMRRDDTYSDETPGKTPPGTDTSNSNRPAAAN